MALTMDEKPWVCAQCGQRWPAFSNRAAWVRLRKAMRVHPGRLCWAVTFRGEKDV